MRRCKPMNISEIWQSFMNDNPRIAYLCRIGRIPQVWSQVAGEQTASVTSISFSKGVATVRVQSPVMRHHLFMQRQEMASRMNELLGAQIIRTLIIR